MSKPESLHINANESVALLPTMSLKFIGGKLHQLHRSNDGSIEQWRIVASE